MKAKETKRRGEPIKKGKGRRMGQEEEEKNRQTEPKLRRLNCEIRMNLSKKRTKM